MLPSDWLARLGPIDFYPEHKLEELSDLGIDYAGGLLTSHLTYGFPYLTYGRLASVNVLTEREFLRECYRLGLHPTFEAHTDGLIVFGFEAIAAVWRLVRPITISAPPSTYAPDPLAGAREDLSAIRRYGY